MSRKSQQLLQLSITRTDPMVMSFESQVEYCYLQIDSHSVYGFGLKIKQASYPVKVSGLRIVLG